MVDFEGVTVDDEHSTPNRDEQTELRASIDRGKLIEKMRLLRVLLVSGVGGACITAVYLLVRSELPMGSEWGGLALMLVTSAFGVTLAIAFSIYKPRDDADQAQRAFIADFEQFEKNVKRDIFRTIRKEQLEKYAPTELVVREVQKRVDDALVSTIDEALQRRLTDGARSVDVIAYIDEIQARTVLALDGPAGRAENRSTWLMRGAITVGILGLAIAVIRVFSLGDYSATLLSLSTELGEKSVWPYVIALSMPWVTVIALVEFSALILLKLSNQFSLLQRQYTELLIEVMDRFLALKAVVRFGDGNQIVSAATVLMNNARRVEGKNESIEESLSAITKVTESLVGVVKQFANKSAKTAE